MNNFDFRHKCQDLNIQNLGWDYILGANLALVGGLERAYYLGKQALSELEPVGHEWWSGCGIPAEMIADREWDTEEHDFEPGNVWAPAGRLHNHEREGPFCVMCGRDKRAWVHRLMDTGET